MVQQYLVSLWFIYSWLLLALQVKVGKVASFVGKIFVVQCHENHEYFSPRKLPANYLLYGAHTQSLDDALEMMASHAHDHAPSMPLVLPSADMCDHIPSHALSTEDTKPPPLIRSASAGDPSRGGNGSSRMSPGAERRKGSKLGLGVKRKPFVSDEDRHGKEKERRNANNQRER